MPPGSLDAHRGQSLHSVGMGSKVHHELPETGSTTLPLWRNATRDPEENAVASSRGFDMPETCFCIARAIDESSQGATRLAQSSSIFLICQQVSKRNIAPQTQPDPHAPTTTVAVA